MRKYLPLLLLVSSPAFAMFGGGVGPGGGWMEHRMGGWGMGGCGTSTIQALNQQMQERVTASTPEVAAKEDAAYKHAKSARACAEKTSSVKDEIRAEQKRASVSAPELSSSTKKYHSTSTEKLVKDFCVDRCIDLKGIPDVSEGELPYHFQSPQGDFRQEVVELYTNLYKIEPKFKKQQNAQQLGLYAVEEADKSFALGDADEADFFKEMGKEFLDIAVGIDPVTGLARSTYELFVGKNFVTGAELGKFERSLAFVGIITGGAGRSAWSAYKGGQATAKIFLRAKNLIVDGKAAKLSVRAGTALIETAGPLLKGWEKNHKITNILTAAEANAYYIKKGWETPYMENSAVVLYNTIRESKFIRVHSEGNQPGRWLLRESSIKGLTPAQIQIKFALPAKPTHFSEALVPAKTAMSRGSVQYHKMFGQTHMPATGKSGAIQYHIEGEVEEFTKMFSNMKSLPEVF